jgi:hypothetical protein
MFAVALSFLQGLIKPIAEHASQKIYTRAVGQ